MTELDIEYRAWLAGFFDGEGNIGVQKDERLLEEIRDAMGWTVKIFARVKRAALLTAWKLTCSATPAQREEFASALTVRKPQ